MNDSQPLAEAALATGPQRHRTRRQYVVDWSLQLRLTRQFGVFAVSAFVLGGLNLYVVVAVVEYVASQPSGFYDLGWPQQLSVLVCVVLLFFVNCALFFLASIFYSHRLAGPQMKIVRALRELQAKDLSGHVSLRRTDLLQEVADELNKVVSGWDEAIQALRMELDVIKRKSADVERTDLTTSLQFMESELASFRGKTCDHA